MRAAVRRVSVLNDAEPEPLVQRYVAGGSRLEEHLGLSGVYMGEPELDQRRADSTALQGRVNSE